MFKGAAAERRTGSGGDLFNGIGSYFKSLDWIQIAAVVYLFVTGLIFIRSIGEQIGGSDPAAYFHKQLQWIAIGSVLWFICTLLKGERDFLKLGSIFYYLGCVAALVLVLFAGVEVYGAMRWLEFFGFRIQPSEYAKLGVILVLGAIFSAPNYKINQLRHLLLVAAVAGVPFLLICKEPDLGSALILLAITLAMIFCAGLRWKYILLAGLAVIIFGGGAIVNEVWRFKPLLKEYQRERIMVFLNPERDRLRFGYNAYQARLAVGSGGFSGKGIGEGTQNELGFLPQTVSNNDFIFSVIAEETGLLGSLALLSGYALLLYSILRTAFNCSSPFGRSVAVGVAAMIFSHMFVNVGMCIGVTPVTGLSLPFVSYGGSFIQTGMLSLGLVQAIHRENRSEK